MKIWICGLLALLIAGIYAAPSVEADIGKGAKKYLPGGGAPTEVTVSENALEISWDTAASKYIEVVLGDRPKLPEFTRAAVTAKIKAPVGCPVTRIGLRLVDTEGETFQYTRQVDFQAGGEFEVVWDIPAGEWKSSWGKKSNKYLDQPARIQGIGIDYRQNSGKAKFQLVSLSATVSGGEMKVAVRPFFPFDSSARCRINGGALLSQGADALTVSGVNRTNVITERRTSLKYIEYKPAVLILEAEKLSGSVTAAWSFKDSKNRFFKTDERVLNAGFNRLIFEVAVMFKDAALPLSSPELVINGSDNGCVLLKSATMGVLQPLPDAVDFEILTGNGIHVLKAGMEKALGFQFSNRANGEGEFNFELEFTHFSGQRFKESFKALLPPGRTATLVPKWQPDRFGHWNVAVEISEKSAPDRSRRVEKSFAYLQPSGPTPGLAPGFLFGVCSHAGRWSRADQLLEAQAAALCGAKVIRDSVEWGGLQPDRDSWNFGTMDFLVELFGSYGIEHQAILAFTPKWAAAPEAVRKAGDWRQWSRSAPEINAWREYARTMMTRYRGQIRYWEVWNEPDLTGFNRMSLEEYVGLQKAAFEVAAQVAPEAMVMTGGFATVSEHSGRKSPTFQEDFLVKAKGFFKVHAYHEHGSFQRFSQMVDERFTPMRQRTGTTVPWYANETAIASLNGSEYNQALTLFKKLLFAWSRGAIGYSWYDLRNDGFNPGDAEHHYGMITNEFYPKPVYSVFNTLTGLFTNARYLEQWDAGANYWVFKFADSDNVLLPAWSESGFGAARMLIVKTDATAAEAVDMMGNAVPQQIIDGMTLLTVNPTPHVLKLKNAKDATNAGTLIAISSGALAVSGKPLDFAVELFNPLKGKHEFQLELTGMPAAFKANNPRQTVTVGPQSSGKAEFRLMVSEDYQPVYGRTDTMQLNYRINGTPWNGTITVPVNSAVLIPKRGELAGRPDFELNKQEQVFSLVGADPALGHRIWLGPDDLSAKIYLTESAGNLRLRAEVTDDVHCQPYSGREVWRGDNIQLSFQVPGQTGYWELGLSHLDSGKAETVVFLTPAGFDADKVSAGMKLNTSRDGVKTVYDLTLNLQAAGLTPELLRQGIRFNLLINENDGEGRDGWMHIAPGIGENKNPDKFPFVIFAK